MQERYLRHWLVVINAMHHLQARWRTAIAGTNVGFEDGVPAFNWMDRGGKVEGGRLMVHMSDHCRLYAVAPSCEETRMDGLSFQRWPREMLGM